MTATRETSEWVVYRIRRHNELNYVPKMRWDGWSKAVKEGVGAVIVAEGLTEKQARQFALLTEET